MANKKITQLTPIVGADLVSADEFVVVDISADETKSIVLSELINGIAALPKSGGAMTGAITTNSTFDGRDVATDGTKLDTIETNATADQTGAEIKSAYEAETSAFTDAQFTKLSGIEASATANQTGAEIKSAYEAETSAFTDAQFTKLSGIEASADVTDTTNVTSAGALMDSELANIAAVKALNQSLVTTSSPTFDTVNATTLLGDGSGLTGIGGTQTGVVNHFAASSAPTGYLKANGATVSRSTYSALFAVVGEVYGAGDGSTTFEVPDLRGEFIRGFDDGRGIDAGRVFGSAQSWAIENITGGAGYFNSLAGVIFSGSLYQKSSTSTADSNAGGTTAYEIGLDASREVQTSAETRPRNVALLACIKF